MGILGLMGLTTKNINRLSSLALVALSATAALSVLIGAGPIVLSGLATVPDRDEGLAAHIFQLTVAATLLSASIFAATADWRYPRLASRPLIVATTFLIIAFVVLYYFEHILGY